jgi:hypothetical protein
MANEERSRYVRDGHEDASVAFAGEAQHAVEGQGVMADRPGPTPEELDAREEQFNRPRKPMGPVDEEDVPPTTPSGP